MKKYEDYQAISDVNWTKYMIVVPTEEDIQELMRGFEHIHYSDIDTNNVVVNQLAHEYLDESRVEGARNNIIVDAELYQKLSEKKSNIQKF
jgi:hypothetical protein